MFDRLIPWTRLLAGGMTTAAIDNGTVRVAIRDWDQPAYVDHGFAWPLGTWPDVPPWYGDEAGRASAPPWLPDYERWPAPYCDRMREAVWLTMVMLTDPSNEAMIDRHGKRQPPRPEDMPLMRDLPIDPSDRAAARWRWRKGLDRPMAGESKRLSLPADPAPAGADSDTDAERDPGPAAPGTLAPAGA